MKIIKTIFNYLIIFVKQNAKQDNIIIRFTFWWPRRYRATRNQTRTLCKNKSQRSNIVLHFHLLLNFV